MAEYLKRCEIVTRMKSRGVDEDVQLVSSKKLKFYSQLEDEHCVDVKLVENSAWPAADKTSGTSEDDELTDLFDRNLRSPDLENVDLKCEGSETEISTSIDGIFSREATKIRSNFWGVSKQESMMDSLTTPKDRPSPPLATGRREIPVSVAPKMPSAAELEEFFAAAENCEQKRFAEKYNFDIVKDLPLEGRYEWVPLQL